MQQLIINTYQNIKKNIKRMSTLDLVLSVALLLFVVDTAHNTYAVYEYKHTAEYLKVTKISNYTKTQENNSSVTPVTVSEFLKDVNPENSIYFIYTKENSIAIVEVAGKKVKIVKNLPSARTISTVESKLIDKNISYEWLSKKKKPESVTSKVFSGKVITFLFLALIGYVLLISSGISIFSKEFSAIYPEDIEGSLDDLIGYDDIKNESRQLLEIITQNNLYAEYGIKGTFNILFSGKAGTGKSKFALYLAKELDIPIVATTGSLDEIYVGSGAKKVRTIFKNAQKAAARSEHNAAIVFIDEAQSMLRKRGTPKDEKWTDDTANELLAYLDGVQSNPKQNIIVIMASNFNENSFEMDEAMLRRFRKKIHFRDPNLAERKEILVHYLDDITQKMEHMDLGSVAKHMSGMTPAIIESVVKEAALLALREKQKIDTDLLMQAIERMLVGNSNRETTQNKEKIREIVAVHEMGHFLVSWHKDMQKHNGDHQKVKNESTVVKVSSESISQLGALGFVLNENSDEMMLQSIEEMEWEIKQLYGGLAAEKVLFGQSGSTTGSANDIKKATKLLAHLMLENSVYSDAKLDHSELGVSEKQMKSMEKKSSLFYKESYKIIEEHKEMLCHLSQKLMEEWSLDKERLFELIANYRQIQSELEESREHGFGILEKEVA